MGILLFPPPFPNIFWTLSDISDLFWTFVVIFGHLRTKSDIGLLACRIFVSAKVDASTLSTVLYRPK